MEAPLAQSVPMPDGAASLEPGPCSMQVDMLYSLYSLNLACSTRLQPYHHCSDLPEDSSGDAQSGKRVLCEADQSPHGNDCRVVLRRY